jgi:hypothetical protein
MNKYQHEAHIYPMKKHWQFLNRIIGNWTWFWTITNVILFPYLMLFFKWMRKVFPAFRKMKAGERRSYLRLSENGLVYRNWPLFELRCKWQDVDRINKGRWLGDTLYLQRAEYIGYQEFSINIGSPQIYLSSLAGWPDGGLIDEFQQYAPQLFMKQS